MSEMTVGMVCEWLTRIGITDARVEAAFRLQHIDGEWDNTFGCLSPLTPAFAPVYLAVSSARSLAHLLDIPYRR